MTHEKIPLFDDLKFYDYIKKVLDNSIETNGDEPINLVGNPFIDNAVITISILYEDYYNNEISPTEVKIKHLIDVFRYSSTNLNNGKEFAQTNYLCSSAFYMLFPNNPLIQASFQSTKKGNEFKPQGKNLPSLKQEHLYNYYLSGFIKNIGQGQDIHCSFCGRMDVFNFHELDNSYLISNDKKAEDFSTGLAKLWYPLTGTIKGEAQAFPGFSEQPKICSLCLILVQFLPQGVKLFRGKILFYITNDIQITKEFLRINVDNIKSKLIAKPNDKVVPPGKGESHISSYVDLLKILDTLKSVENEFNISSSLMIWLVSNSNTDVTSEIEELPRTMILNLFEFYSRWKEELTQFLTYDQKSKSPNSFIETMKKGIEYHGFYADTTKQIPSQEFFESYQILIVERERSILEFYKIVSQRILHTNSRKEIDAILSKGKFSEKRQLIYRTIIDLALENKISLNTLLRWIFEQIPRRGFRPFDYYLHKDADLTLSDLIDDDFSFEVWDLINEIANRYYHKASLRGGFNKHSFLNQMRQEKSSRLYYELESLGEEVAGLSWKKVLTKKKLLNSIPGKNITALLLFKIACIQRFDTSQIKSNIDHGETTFEGLVEDSLLTSNLIQSLLEYLNIRSLEFSPNRAIKDMLRLIQESNRSLYSLIDFFSMRGIDIQESEFYQSQNNSDIFLGEVNPSFSWNLMKRQITNFVSQLSMIQDWETKIQILLEEKNK